MSRTPRPSPPGGKSRDRGVVKSHLRIHVENLPTELANPQAKLVILGGDDICAETTGRLKNTRPHDELPAGRLDLARLSIPLEFTQAIVDSRSGKSLVKMPANDGDILSLNESSY